MSLFNFKTCTEACEKLDEPCPNSECRNWMNYEEDLNCAVLAADKHGELTLREVSKRIGLSFVRVKQLEDSAREKIKAYLQNTY
jgi:hypothetical protein